MSTEVSFDACYPAMAAKQRTLALKKPAWAQPYVCLAILAGAFIAWRDFATTVSAAVWP